jgi:hypothetical protein
MNEAFEHLWSALEPEQRRQLKEYAADRRGEPAADLWVAIGAVEVPPVFATFTYWVDDPSSGVRMIRADLLDWVAARSESDEMWVPPPTDGHPNGGDWPNLERPG